MAWILEYLLRRDPKKILKNIQFLRILGRFVYIECTGFLLSPRTVLTGVTDCFLSGDQISRRLWRGMIVGLNPGYFRLELIAGLERVKAKPFDS